MKTKLLKVLFGVLVTAMSLPAWGQTATSREAVADTIIEPYTFDDVETQEMDDELLSDLYIQDSNPDPIIEIGTAVSFPWNSINAFTHDQVDFGTGRQHFLTANLYWKWLVVGYSLPLANYTNGYDWKFSPRFGPILLQMGISRIKNYHIVNKNRFLDLVARKYYVDSDQLKNDIKLDGLETFNWHVGIEWFSNSRNFSPSSAFSQGYSRGQRVSAGSMLFGLWVQGNQIRNTKTAVSPMMQDVIDGISSNIGHFYDLGLGMGYGYNFVAREGKVVLGLYGLPYVSGVKTRRMISADDAYHYCVGFRAHARANVTYQYSKGFISLFTNYLGLLLLDRESTFMQNNVNVSLNFAFKLGIKSNKVPGHQAIDWVDRLIAQ